jgi:hypothetical protein
MAPSDSKAVSQSKPRRPRAYTPEEAASMMEIQQKIYFYGWCIDHRDFAALDELFLPGAIIHYDVQDGTKAPWEEMRNWLPAGLEIFRVTQHNMSNPMIELDGDSARSRTYGHLIHLQDGGPDDEVSVMRHHSIYHDEWKRRSGEWRIASRTLTNLYIDGPVRRGDDVATYRRAQPF